MNMTCTDIATWVGTIIGIVSFIVTIAVAQRTKRVEIAVKEKEEASKRKLNYKNKQQILYKKLCEVERRFIGDEGKDGHKELINDCDQVLSELESCIPRKEAIDLIKKVRDSLKKEVFTPSMIMNELHDIITILSEEEL